MVRNLVDKTKCCCDGEEYNKIQHTVGIRLRIHGAFSAGGRGQFDTCGHCKERYCLNVHGSGDIPAIFAKRLPGASKFVKRYVSLIVNIDYRWCSDGNIEGTIGVSARFLRVGSVSVSTTF